MLLQLTFEAKKHFSVCDTPNKKVAVGKINQK